MSFLKHLKKKKVRYGRVVFSLTFALCVLATITFVVAKPDTYKEFKNIKEDNKTVGSMMSIIEENEKNVRFLYYPKFDNETIDHTIQAYIETLSSKSSILFLDYESNEVFERYITVHFTFQTRSMESVIESESHTYLNFDKTTGKQLQLVDVLRKDYQDLIHTEMAKVHGTLDSLDTANFKISDVGIQIYDNDQKEILIAYNTNQAYIRLPEKSIAERVVEKKRNRTIDPDRPMIALTFDDGPSRYTEDFINTLVAHDASGTFFMLGKNIAAYPDIVQRMVEEDLEIGNHSWDHQNVAKDDATFIKQEIYDTQDALFRLTGHEPTKFRPPYGAHNDLSDQIAEQGGIQTALWTVDTEDWKNRDASITLERARNGIKDGAIILFHDLYPSSLEALQTLLPELKAAGYQLVSFSEIIEYKYAD